MPADGGHNRQGKSDSIIKVLNVAASKITVIVERFKDDTITSNHDFSKIPRADLKVFIDLLQNFKNLNKDFLSQEGEDPNLQIYICTGIVEIL